MTTVVKLVSWNNWTYYLNWPALCSISEPLARCTLCTHTWAFWRLKKIFARGDRESGLEGSGSTWAKVRYAKWREVEATWGPICKVEASGSNLSKGPICNDWFLAQLVPAGLPEHQRHCATTEWLYNNNIIKDQGLRIIDKGSRMKVRRSRFKDQNSRIKDQTGLTHQVQNWLLQTLTDYVNASYFSALPFSFPLLWFSDYVNMFRTRVSPAPPLVQLHTYIMDKEKSWHTAKSKDSNNVVLKLGLKKGMMPQEAISWHCLNSLDSLQGPILEGWWWIHGIDLKMLSSAIASLVSWKNALFGNLERMHYLEI